MSSIIDLPATAALPSLPSPSQELAKMTDTHDPAVEPVDPKAMTLLQVLATSDQGEMAAGLNKAFNDVVRTLMNLEVNDGVRKSKGSLTIKLAITYEDGTVKLNVEEKIAVPKAPQRAAVYWVTGDGRLTPENPRQMSMFRDVPRRSVTVI